MSENRPGRFSDIDVVLSAAAGASDLRFLLEGWERPVMGFYTVNPPGILTVVYARGFCVEAGIRRTMAQDEMPRTRVLLNHGLVTAERAEFIDIARLYRPDYITYGDGPRVLYKAMLKFLNGKPETAFALLEELNAGGKSFPRSDFTAQWEETLHKCVAKENLSDPAAGEFAWLLDRARENVVETLW